MTTANIAYGISTALTVTAINGLANDTTQLVGAESSAVTNTSTLADDYMVTFTIKMSGTPPTTGKQVGIYCAISEDGTTFTGGAAGASGAKTFVLENLALMKPVIVFNTNATASATYVYVVPSIRDLIGTIPRKFSFWVTQNSGQALNAAGNSITVTAITYTNT